MSSYFGNKIRKIEDDGQLGESEYRKLFEYESDEQKARREEEEEIERQNRKKRKEDNYNIQNYHI